MEMVSLLVKLGIVLLMAMQCITSSAQSWEDLAICSKSVESSEEFQLECCPTFQQDIMNDRESFCSIKPEVTANATFATGVSDILIHCGVTSSFDTLCLDYSTPSTPTSLSTETPEQDVNNKNCWTRILQCNKESTSRVECCPVMKKAITDARVCFCNTIEANDLRHDSAFTNQVDKDLTLCGIPGTLDTVCPRSYGAKLIGSSAMKIGYSVGLLSIALLMMWAIIMS